MIKLLATIASNVNLDDIGSFISSIGFPIFVAVWLLYKSHKDNALIQESINNLENTIIELNAYIRTLSEKVK